MAKLSDSKKTTKKATTKDKKAPPRPETLGTSDATDEHDDEEGNPKGHLPKFRRFAVHLRNSKNRVSAKARDIATWIRSDAADLGIVVENLEQVVKCLAAAEAEMEKLPDGYRPTARGAASGKAKLEEGVRVRIRDDKRERYDGMIPLDETFKIIGFRKRNVKVETSEGIVFLPRGDLTIVKDGEAAA